MPMGPIDPEVLKYSHWATDVCLYKLHSHDKNLGNSTGRFVEFTLFTLFYTSHNFYN